MKLTQSLLATPLVFMALFAPAAAQETDEPRETAVARVLNKVTVSATKKSDVEDVQDVPIAVTAFNSDTLEALQVRDLEGLTYSAPNVSLDDLGTSRGTANFSIRGLGINSSIPSIDPTVGVFVDGVYLGLNNGVVMDLFDLDSVEVLRGPQGLLFGRNTTGGAIVINTGNPTDDFRWKARASIDGPIDDDRGGTNSTFQGAVSGPLVDGKLNGKFGAYHNTDSGYFKNLFTDDNHGEAQTTILRGALDWTPTDAVSILTKIETFDSRGDGAAAQSRGTFDRESFDFSSDCVSCGYDLETVLGSVRADIDVPFGNGRITNIFGYRDYDGLTQGDIDALPANIFTSDTELAQEQFSNELRYAGTFGRADVTTGLYWFNQDVAFTEIRHILGTDFYGGGAQDHSVYGVFAQVDYAITDKFTGIFGLRYSSEEKDASVTFIRPRAACSVVDGSCPTSGTNPAIPAESNGFTDKNDWSNVTPKIGFQYTPSDNAQIYGGYTRGFRSGGYNFRITNVSLFEEQTALTGQPFFDEESVDSYELGAKMETTDRRGQLNASLFRTEISDMQREVNVSSPTSGVSQFILNTAEATINGVELEGRWAISDTLLITGNLGYIDASYDKVLFDISGDGVVDANDASLDLPRVPEMTYGFGLVHDLSLGDKGALVSRLNFQYRDEFAYTDNNFGWIQEADMLSANVTWNSPFEGLSISVYGKNLLDEVQAGGDTQLPFAGPLSDGTNDRYGYYPAAGTFSPLKKGRLIGVEVTLTN